MADNTNAKSKALVIGAFFGLVGVGFGISHLIAEPAPLPKASLSEMDKEKTAELSVPVNDAARALSYKAALDVHVPRDSKEARKAPLFFAPQLWQVTYKDGNKVVDIYDPNIAPLHGDVPNSWFIENNLLSDIGKADALSIDSDGDGFSNLEEFRGNTKPNDAQSYPPLVQVGNAKLEATKVNTQRVLLVVEPMFATSNPMPESAAITVTKLTRKGQLTTATKKKDYKVGDSVEVLSEPNRFKVAEFTQKEYTASYGGKETENVVMLQDCYNPAAAPIPVRAGKPRANETHHSVRRGLDITDSQVTLRVTAGSTAGKEFTVRVGQSFSLPNADGSEVECVLEDVNEKNNSVNIRAKGIESPIAVPQI